MSIVGHLVEYTLLGAALRWATRWPPWRVVAAGAPLALVDELYQRTFGSGRSFDVTDLAVDVAGLLVGAALAGVVAGGTSGR